MKYLVIAIEYGEPMPEGGAYDHPNGQTCALRVNSVTQCDCPEEALALGIEMESFEGIHHCLVEEDAA